MRNNSKYKNGRRIIINNYNRFSSLKYFLDDDNFYSKEFFRESDEICKNN